MRISHRILTAVVTLAASLSLSAQTATPTITELSLERTLTLPNILTSATLNIPAEALAAVAAGTAEVRERLIYNPSGSTLTSTVFTVLPGAPNPTPINANFGATVVGQYALSVEKIYLTTTPANSLLLVGTVSSGSPGGVLGSVSGLPFSVSMTYTNDTPAKVADLVHVIAGRVMIYSKDAAGSLVLPKPVVPPTPGAGPQITIAAPTSTVSREVTLDASATTDASNTTLTFAWRSVSKSAVMLNPNTAKPTIQFAEGTGDYTFEVTVTNGNGVAAKKTVTVTYYGR